MKGGRYHDFDRVAGDLTMMGLPPTTWVAVTGLGTGSVESSGKSSVQSSGKTENLILGLLSARREMTIPDLAKTLGLSPRAVEKQIAKLRQDGRLRRVGSKKAGYWEVARLGA